MYKNYFYLNRAIVEQRAYVIGKNIYDIYSQEKDTLYFNISSEDDPDLHLILSINQNEPYLIIKDHHKKKKNTVRFFETKLPQKIIDLQISTSDRILKIICERAEIYIPIRGTLSNVISRSLKGDLEFFKKVKNIDEDQYVTELVNHQYNPKFNLPDFDSSTAEDINELRKSFPYLTKNIINELKARKETSDFAEQKKILLKLLTEIRDEDITVFYSDELGKYHFQPASFIAVSQRNEIYRFGDYQSAVLKLITESSRYSRQFSLQKEIGKYIEKELSGLSAKLNDMRKRVEKGSKDGTYRHYADLLLSNLHLLKKGMKEVELKDFDTEETVKINLNENKSPNENVNYYYDKARGERINYEKSKELFEENNARYNNLLQLKNRFELTEDISELESIKSDLGIKQKIKTEKMDDKIKFRHFVIDNKYHVFVGRDSKSNDLLTVKFAKQNDYWFHARGYAGSHVVLRVDNPKDGVPKNILKNTASIAAFYSKAKTAGTAPVACTFAKYVNKRKGMEPGKVTVQREEVFLVKPGIPNNAEMLED